MYTSHCGCPLSTPVITAWRREQLQRYDRLFLTTDQLSTYLHFFTWPFVTELNLRGGRFLNTQAFRIRALCTNCLQPLKPPRMMSYAIFINLPLAPSLLNCYHFEQPMSGSVPWFNAECKAMTWTSRSCHRRAKSEKIDKNGQKLYCGKSFFQERIRECYFD